MEYDPRVSIFAKTNFRNEGKAFGIRQADRFGHMHIIGKTGTGKSTLLETLISQDIEAGRGCALIDPHGDLATRVVARVSSAFSRDMREQVVPIRLRRKALSRPYDAIADPYCSRA